MFKGSFAALLTPMHEDGRVDEGGFARFIEWQIAEGTHGIVPCGTTGEAPTLSDDEQHRLFAVAVEAAAGRVPVIVGAGSNNTASAIRHAAAARRARADGLMVVAPYYNRPSQEGLYRHYRAIAESTELPILIYNIPGRAAVDMSVATMARLAELPNIVGVKDATANLARPLHTRRACGAGFVQFSGEDHTAVAFLASGGDGCISVTANVAPKLCAAMHEAWQTRQVERAIAIQDQLLPLHDAMFCESSPGPAKFAASLLGLMTDTMRPPLAPIAEASRETVRAALAETGLLA